MDGNRTPDVYSLRPGGTASSPCFPGTCTAKYSYDPRDRLVSHDEGHGNLTSFSLDGAGNILSQAKNGTTTVTNTYNGQEHRNTLSVKSFTYDVNGHRLAMTNTPYHERAAGDADHLHLRL